MKVPKIKPLEDTIIVSQASNDRITEGGIVIPDLLEKPEHGIAVAVGPGRRLSADERVPMTVRVGDRVTFNKNMVQQVRIDNEEYLAVRERHLYAVTAVPPGA